MRSWNPLGVGVSAAALLAAAVASVGLPVRAEVDKRVLEAEAKRVAVVAKVRPTVVAIFAPGGQGGGSGVLISDDGYALTNFHVVEGSGPVMKCGLADGVLYDGVLVGLDKVGDVALIKLLPKKEGAKFPFAKMGDSDKLQAGDWSFAMGNPFLLATDFTPTVTFGLISGVNRYQYPAGTLLEYTDCIQIDTSINPGNSGGPLYNIDGDLIGINGRGSFEKRGRVNSGVGYAISINQIKNFMGHLRAGLDSDHASLGARVEEKAEEGIAGQLVVSQILEDCDARRRGLDREDELVEFGGRHMDSVNTFKNTLGLFPRGWRVPLTYRHENAKKEIEKREVLVRLMGVQRQEIGDRGVPKPPDQPQPKPGPKPKPTNPNSPAAKLFEAKPGYANYYFNRMERDRLLAEFRKEHGDFAAVHTAWQLDAEGTVRERKATAQITIKEEQEKDAKVGNPIVGLTISDVDYSLQPLKGMQELARLKDPDNSGGLMMALYHYWQFLTVGEKAFEGGFHHGGSEPFYLPAADGQRPDYKKLRVDCEVIRTEHNGIPAKWYFSQKDKHLVGFEVQVDPEDDPCEVYLSDYKKVDGRDLPHRIEVRYANGRYGVFNVKSYKIAAK